MEAEEISRNYGAWKWFNIQSFLKINFRFFSKTLYRTSQFFSLETPVFSAAFVESSLLLDLTNLSYKILLYTDFPKYCSVAVNWKKKKKKKTISVFLTSESVQCFYPQNIFKENDTGFVHGIAHAEICGILNCVVWEGKNIWKDYLSCLMPNKC